MFLIGIVGGSQDQLVIGMHYLLPNLTLEKKHPLAYRSSTNKGHNNSFFLILLSLVTFLYFRKDREISTGERE